LYILDITFAILPENGTLKLSHRSIVLLTDEQFFQVVLLDLALISLSLALDSSKDLCKLGLYGAIWKCSLKLILTSLYLVEGLALYLVN